MDDVWEEKDLYCTDKCLKLDDKEKCSALGEAGCRIVCLVSGGDGGDLVRPAALPWSVTSSPGPWYCGHSTKPRRGHRERRLEMNVGVGLDVCLDVDVNEPLHD